MMGISRPTTTNKGTGSKSETLLNLYYIRIWHHLDPHHLGRLLQHQSTSFNAHSITDKSEQVFFL